MGALGKKLRGLQGGRVAFWCPGCEELHEVTVRPEGERPVPSWEYNGNPDAPTFRPSIKVTGLQTVKEKGEWTGEWVTGPDGKALPMCCHSYVTDGRIQFLGDCTHDLVGLTVDIPDLDDVGMGDS